MDQEIQNIEPQVPHSSKTNLAVPLSIIVAGLIIAGAIFMTNRTAVNKVANNPSQRNSAQQQPAQSPDVSKVKTEDKPFLGNPNAQLTMAYWSDYQCPFCKRFETDVMPQIITNYVKTGKVKIVYKDFQFLGPDSQTAGLASHAVWEVAPNKYYDWHKALYDKQDGENSGWGSKEDILALAKNVLGNDTATKVSTLMDSKQAEYQKAMDDDKTEGASFGINGTPGTIVGTHMIEGAQPYSAVKQIIDLALQGK